MLNMTLQEMPVFGQEIIESVLADLIESGYNVIRCSLTGSIVGHIDSDEMRLCLRMELDREPLMTRDDLFEAFALRAFMLSSGPAPSLRVHKDHSTLVRVLRIHKTGAQRLLAYLSGRLFYDSLVPVRERETLDNRRARYAFLMDFNARVESLKIGWSHSLTADDEAFALANNAIALLSQAVGAPITLTDEGKAAQGCLEVLLRLDSIHNVTNSFYTNNMREALIAFRDSNDFTFKQYLGLLEALEQDAIDLASRTKSSPMGNSMALTAALEAIGWTTKRIGVRLDRTIANLEKAELAGKLGRGTRGSALMMVIKEFVAQETRLSKTDKKNIKSVIAELQRETSRVTYSDKRLSALHHKYGVNGERAGTVKVIKPVTVATKITETFRNNLNPQLKAKLDQQDAERKLAKEKRNRPTAADRIAGMNINFAELMAPDLAGLQAPEKKSKTTK